VLNFINWFLIYIYSIMQLILFWDAISTKIDTLNVIILTKNKKKGDAYNNFIKFNSINIKYIPRS